MRKFITVAAVILAILAITSVTSYAEESGGESYAASEAARVTALTVRSYPDKTIYDAFERLDKTGLRIVAHYDDGSERELSPEEIEVRYQKDTCLRVGDSLVFLSYGGLTVSLPITVNRVEYDLSSLEISDFSVTYNGRFNSFITPLPDVVGLDGIALKVKVRGGGESVGKYDVSIDFESESSDYYIPDTRVITMTVEAYRAEIVWENLSFVYDGKSKLPRAHFIDVFGNKIYPEAIGSATNAGADYSARVIWSDPNYVLDGAQTKYEIKKADYDFSDVVWSCDSFVYDGSSKSISVSGLPDGVKVVSYRADKATDAGKYTAAAKLAWDETNYNAPSTLTHTWEISPAQYDLSGFEFVPGEFVYDGKIHYPKLEGSMPVGKDGIALEYSFSEGACHVSDGAVSVTVSFSTKSKNYKIPDPVYSSVSVTPLDIEVLWGVGELYYTGEAQAPAATSSECVVKVRGGETDVGKYVAEAYTENADYRITNSLFEYTVKKAENRWIDVPARVTCYEGRELVLPAYAKFGKAEFVFYSDAEGKKAVSAPTSAGRFYAKAVVLATENYSGIESAIFPLEIVKITATSFLAELNKKDFKAYERVLPSDIIPTVVNNDGSRETVDSSLVSVSYQNGDSLRKRDEYVTVKFGKFSYKVGISVDYADYDMGGAFWTNTDAEYDGEAKTPTLSGLPDGVSVKEYVGGGARDAGRYTVDAILAYDSENYNQPKVEGCTLTIRKRILALPTFSTSYTGSLQMPKSDSALYTVTSSEGFRYVGKYNVTVAVSDSKNYEFADGTDSAETYFVITPMVIGVAIDDVELHLFERLGNVEYTVTSGEYAHGDLPLLAKYIEKRTVYLRSVDPNYTIVCTGGAIKRLPYPTASFTLYFLLVIASLLALCLAGYFLLLRRHRLENAIAVLKCRWHNRNLSPFPPRAVKKKKSFNPEKPTDPSHGGEEREAPKAVPDPETMIKSDTRDLEGEKFEDRKPDALDLEDEESAACKLPTDNAETCDLKADGEEVCGAESGKASDEEENDGQDAEAQTDAERTVTLEGGFGMDAERADALITDSLAKNLINRDGEIIYTDGKSKNIVNVDTLSENFTPGDRVDVNSLKNKSLVPYDTAYIKVLARGMIDKPLTVYANDFSLSAVKMIALTGGEAIKAVTVRRKNEPKTDGNSGEKA